ncbi:Trimethylguanosine synthase [Geranomyces variabilis]|uniref:Trimethylguanosine synthase n=1 Tax=Geranomyces variabilis TaxID=109894 RepID=A0AAD5TE92_9FUNG|nr:Trimethylguanosine synthase [Geranomyces variabilis]
MAGAIAKLAKSLKKPAEDDLSTPAPTQKKCHLEIVLIKYVNVLQRPPKRARAESQSDDSSDSASDEDEKLSTAGESSVTPATTGRKRKRARKRANRRRGKGGQGGELKKAKLGGTEEEANAGSANGNVRGEAERGDSSDQSSGRAAPGKERIPEKRAPKAQGHHVNTGQTADGKSAHAPNVTKPPHMPEGNLSREKPIQRGHDDGLDKTTAGTSSSNPSPSAAKAPTTPAGELNQTNRKPNQLNSPVSQQPTPNKPPQASRAAAFLAMLREREINGGAVEPTPPEKKPPPSGAMLKAMQAVLGPEEIKSVIPTQAGPPNTSEPAEDAEYFEEDEEEGEEEWLDDEMYIWSEEYIPKRLKKYWIQRYNLFSRFDEGVMLDEESWYYLTRFSITPERLAKHHATRMACDTIIDAFCGAGGNSIQFAMTCKKVIAIDIDPVKLRCARHNAELYGVADKIEFVLGDALEVLARKDLRADVVFLSPPWGGPKYLKAEVFDFHTMLPLDGAEMFARASAVTRNVCLYMPRNSDRNQLIELAAGITATTTNTAAAAAVDAELTPACEIEEEHLNGRQKAIAAYYGGLVRVPAESPTGAV